MKISFKEKFVLWSLLAFLTGCSVLTDAAETAARKALNQQRDTLIIRLDTIHVRLHDR